jgi:hypothetical protein
MSKTPDHILLDLLYRAHHSERGIVVETSNVDALRQKLYRLRKQDPELSSLILSPWPTAPATHLAIVRPADEPT